MYRFVLAYILTNAFLATFVIADPTADGRFYGSHSKVVTVAPGVMAYSTDCSLYVSTDSGQSWKSIYMAAERKGEPFFRGCVGGGPTTLKFILSLLNTNLDPTATTLMSWSPEHGVSRVCELPTYSACLFQSATIGAYVHLRQVFFTSDGGSSWHESEPVAPGDPKEAAVMADALDRMTLCYIAWAAPNVLAVVAQDGTAEVYEVAADGSSHPRWSKQIGCSELYAAGADEVWVNNTLSDTVRLKLTDGSVIQKISRGPKGRPMVLQEHHAYAAGVEGVEAYEVGGETVKLLSKLKLPFAGALSLLPNGHIAVFNGDGMWDWDGKAPQARLTKPAIDNTVVREALKPTPDKATLEQLREMIQWHRKTDDRLAARIEAFDKTRPQASNRENVLWRTEQFRKAALTGQWEPPTTLPATAPAPSSQQ